MPRNFQRSKMGVDQSPEGRKKRTCPRCGHTFDSLRELRHDLMLHDDLDHGRIVAYERQFRIYLERNGARIRPFTGQRDAYIVVDFRVVYPDGHDELHEAKGKRNSKDPDTRLWMLKLGIVQAMYPELRILLV